MVKHDSIIRYNASDSESKKRLFIGINCFLPHPDRPTDPPPDPTPDPTHLRILESYTVPPTVPPQAARSGSGRMAEIAPEGRLLTLLASAVKRELLLLLSSLTV
jgi:hypothetical protein